MQVADLDLGTGPAGGDSDGTMRIGKRCYVGE